MKNYTKTPVFEDYPHELIDMDFNNVIPLLKSAISHIEQVDLKPEGETKEKIKRLLDDESIFAEQKIEILLEKKDSKTPLLNLAEFLYFAKPDKSVVWQKKNIFFFIFHYFLIS